MIIHTVQPGETVYSIASQYGVSDELTIINNGLEGITNALPPGLGLVILIPAVTYTVNENDSTRSVAAKFGITQNSLYRHNLILGGQDTIYPGQTLVISYADPPIYNFEIGGYSYTFITDKLLNETLPAMKLFMPFTYGFTPDGRIVELDDYRLLARAYHYGTSPYFHLSTLTENGSFSNELSHNILADESVWPALADNIIAIMNRKSFVGLDIDFEFLRAEDREIYPQFIAYMRERINFHSYPLIVALPPKVSSDQPGQLYEGIDYAALGQAADYCLLMTYEWGYTYGPPMPVSPTPSIRRVLDYAITEISPEKIYMGISNYGYDWPLPYVRGKTRATSLSNVEAVRLASETGSEIMYSEEYDAPYFNYTAADGTEHEVWFEDARSIYAKLALISEYSFHGGLYWNLNRQNPQNLSVLSALIQYNS